MSKKNPVRKLIKSTKEIGWKKTWGKWKYNFIMLDTPQQLLRKEVYGWTGALCGNGLAFILTAWTKNYIMLMLYAGLMLVFYSNVKGKLKQLQTLKDIEENFAQEDGKYVR